GQTRRHDQRDRSVRGHGGRPAHRRGRDTRPGRGEDRVTPVNGGRLGQSLCPATTAQAPGSESVCTGEECETNLSEAEDPRFRLPVFLTCSNITQSVFPARRRFWLRDVFR